MQLGSPIERIDNLVGRGIDQKKPCLTGSCNTVFLRLLPGPCDRRGYSQLLKQLVQRIESSRSGETFAVGLVFGPSGCGKSSLLKAGVLPRLNGRVRHVCFEATTTDTIEDLGRQLRQRMDGPASDTVEPIAVREILAQVRRGEILKPGEKLVIALGTRTLFERLPG